MSKSSSGELEPDIDYSGAERSTLAAYGIETAGTEPGGKAQPPLG